MTTTIIKRVSGSIMKKIFDQAEQISVRYYTLKGNISESEYNEKNEYTFEIVIRHQEGTDAKKLFNKEVQKIKSGCRPE